VGVSLEPRVSQLPDQQEYFVVVVVEQAAQEVVPRLVREVEVQYFLVEQGEERVDLQL
jgi:hypothetical protein